MRYREVVLENWSTLDDSGTKTINLDLVDPVSVITVGLEATNHATGPNAASPPSKCVSKIEVVDGGNVLWSLSGTQLQALASAVDGVPVVREIDDTGSATQRDFFPLQFGRFIGDTEFSLDPRKFVNPQLKITWDLAAVNTVGANGYATGTGKLKVVARVMEGGPAPTRVLVAKDHYDFTTVASGDERVDLPTDMPYRVLLVRAYESGVELTTSITNLKLSVDQDKFVPFDLSTADLIRVASFKQRPVSVVQDVYVSGSAAKQLWLAHNAQAVATAKTAGYGASLGSISGSQATVAVGSFSTTGTVADTVHLYTIGYNPENSVHYVFGELSAPDTWYTPQPQSSLRLYLTQGNAGAAASVVLQQAKNY